MLSKRFCFTVLPSTTRSSLSGLAYLVFRMPCIGSHLAGWFDSITPVRHSQKPIFTISDNLIDGIGTGGDFQSELVAW